MRKVFVQSVVMVSLLMGFGSVSFAHEHDGDTNAPISKHLSFKNNTLHIHASFPVAPVVGEESMLVLETRDAQTHGPTEIEDTVQVVLWMPSMGHGSAPTVVEKVAPDVYHVKNVYFIMGGEWDVQVLLKDAQGQTEMKSFKMNFGGGHGGHN